MKAPEEAETLTFRPLREKDLPQIFSIEKAVYDEPWSEDLLRESLKAPMTHHLGVFEDKRCRAYGIYQVIFQEAHLLNLAVAPESQGQGQGRRLLKKIIEEIKAQGAFSFFLEVRPSNTRAIQLYESLGFRVLMTRDAYYSDGEAAYIMLADLLR